MIEKAIGKLVESIHLTSDEAEEVMDQIMTALNFFSFNV